MKTCKCGGKLYRALVKDEGLLPMMQQKCMRCGEGLTTLEEMQHVERLTVEVLIRDHCPDIPAVVVTAARKALGLTRAALAEKLKATAVSVKRWESEGMRGSAGLALLELFCSP